MDTGRELHEVTAILMSAWALGMGSERIRVSDGTLDRALRKLHESGDFPEFSGLSFGCTSIGDRCYEMEDIFSVASECYLGCFDGSTFTTFAPQISEDSARVIALQSGLTTARAREIGGTLAAAVKADRERMAELEQGRR